MSDFAITRHSIMRYSCAILVLLVFATTGTVASASAPTGPPSPGSRYVGIGSSFASGFGIAKQQATCGRSNHNYAHLVAQKLKLRLTDVSCAGATTADVLHKSGSMPAQAKAVTAATRLISMTIGGNDIEYPATTLECAGEGDCLKSVDKKKIKREVAALPGRLTRVISTLKSRAPKAEILLLTYPQVVPAHNICKALSLRKDEAAYIHGLGSDLQAAFVRVAKATGVVLVNVYKPSVGHGACSASHTRWVAGANANNGFPFHPTALGHRETAKLIIEKLHAS